MISVIFDMDGTLLDTQQICIPAWEKAGQNQGFIGIGNDIPNVCGMNIIGWTAYLNKKYPTLNADKFNKEMREYIVANQVVKYREGAAELLDFLKQSGIKIGLASGSSRPSVMHHLNEVGATDYFCAITAGTEVDNGKPAPDIFLLTAEKMGVKPYDCIVFEDSANGVRAAAAAGMRCIGFPDIAPLNDVHDLLFDEVDNLENAIDILKELI